MWFETIIPGFDEAFFVIAQPPTAIPQPEIGQNELLTVEMNLTIEDFKGMESKVPFTAGATGYSARSTSDSETDKEIY